MLYDERKSFLDAIAPNKDCKERIEVIADKDSEKLEFTIQELKYKVSKNSCVQFLSMQVFCFE